MVDAIRQIRQEIKTLNQAIATLATELDGAYDEYLMTLRTSIQKQGVVACYHLCTHSYPEQFLQLSFRQREEFQQAIQSHIHQAQQRLMNAYVLATTLPQPDEAEQAKRGKRRRSLPSSDRPSSPSRRRSNDSDGDGHGPSIEFIAIGGDVDEEDVMAIANDPSLAAALGELADNLSLDRGEIADRIKRELLSKLSNAEFEEIDSSEEEETPWAEDNAAESDGPESSAENASIAKAPQPSAATPSSVLPANQMPLEKPSAEPKGEQPESDAQAPEHSSTFETSGIPDGSAAKYSKFAAGDEVSTPVELLARQDNLEQNVIRVLHDLSQQINRKFHQTGMIPRKLPGAVLEAALKSEASAEPSSGSPNVLSLLVEAEGKAKTSKVMRIKALNLRPSELEFSDPYLSTCRSHLRELTEKLQKMGKAYDKKQRSRAIAEAEAAWRSSWYERDD